jgi:hypothetical protein
MINQTTNRAANHVTKSDVTAWPSGVLHLVATAIILRTQPCVVQPDLSCCQNPQNVVPACSHELLAAAQDGAVKG